MDFEPLIKFLNVCQNSNKLLEDCESLFNAQLSSFIALGQKTERSKAVVTLLNLNNANVKTLRLLFTLAVGAGDSVKFTTASITDGFLNLIQNEPVTAIFRKYDQG